MFRVQARAETLVQRVVYTGPQVALVACLAVVAVLLLVLLVLYGVRKYESKGVGYRMFGGALESALERRMANGNPDTVSLSTLPTLVEG